MAMGLLSGHFVYADIGEAVRDTVEYLEVGEAVYYGELTIIPIHSTRIKDYTHYVTLDMALKNKYLQIREIDGGNVPEVMLSNISDKTIYIMGGEILTGCKQDRIVGKDLLIRPKGKKVLVPVYCVEQGRWFHNSKEFHSQKNLGTYKLRAAAQGASGLAQQEIWDEVEKSNKKMSVRSSTNAYQDVYKDKEVEKKIKAIEQGIARGLELEEDTIGVAVGLGNKIISVDIFANPYLFKEMWPKILKSSALSAVSNDREAYISRQDALVFLETVYKCSYTRKKAIDLGFELFCENGKLTVNALVFRDAVIHLAAFPREEEQISGKDIKNEERNISSIRLRY
jgi:hypothetical protein